MDDIIFTLKQFKYGGKYLRIEPVNMPTMNAAPAGETFGEELYEWAI